MNESAPAVLCLISFPIVSSDQDAATNVKSMIEDVVSMWRSTGHAKSGECKAREWILQTLDCNSDGSEFKREDNDDEDDMVSWKI